MTTPRRSHGTAILALAAGAVAALLATAAPATAAAPHGAAGSSTAGRSARTARAGEVFTCTYIDDKKVPDVYGRGCTPQKVGALSDFTIRPALLGSSYHCQTGWADGLEVINGSGCQKIS
ncbi:hypothetical protein E6W39_08170 [Kitasatospora acidiphila]|uniref:Secreted protein n=1 Tax=Kitasatospora acidiphila TaxID=2567942 RepID=A0A540VZT5_9ACTN|nr:hypothetical protein [Kitasatospora acidiphila]TQF02251.1 hypothetical protein E6W39_08170 [Kitasatospora acidiphila]